MLLSGMTWTGFWGKHYADVWNSFPAAMWNDVPTSDQQARELNSATRQTVPWAVENTPMPQSGAHAEHAGHTMGASAPARSWWMCAGRITTTLLAQLSLG